MRNLLIAIALVLPSLAYSGQERDGSWRREFGRKILEASQQDLLLRLRASPVSSKEQFFRSFSNAELERLVRELREAAPEEERKINPPGQEHAFRRLYYTKTGPRTILALAPFFQVYENVDFDALPRRRADEQIYQVQSLILREIAHYDDILGNMDSLEKAKWILSKLGKNGHVSEPSRLSCTLGISDIMETKSLKSVRVVYGYECSDGDSQSWSVDNRSERSEATTLIARRKGVRFQRCDVPERGQFTPKPQLVIFHSKCYFYGE